VSGCSDPRIRSKSATSCSNRPTASAYRPACRYDDARFPRAVSVSGCSGPRIRSKSATVETQFLWKIHLGETVLPYRLHPPRQAIIPWDGQQLLSGGDERLDLYPGLAAWWRNAEELWNANRSSDRLSLHGQLDYRRKLSDQFPVGAHRVVYSASGQYLAAARVSDPRCLVEHKLYWATVASENEADFLVAILNSNTLTRRVAPLQGRGEHNPRDFDKYVFRLPIPLFNPNDRDHQAVVDLAHQAEDLVGRLPLPAASFQAQRRRLRQALDDSPIGPALDAAVAALLDGQHSGGRHGSSEE
jgi:hypothetical protein